MPVSFITIVYGSPGSWE